MRNIKGFCVFPSRANNTLNVVSPIGELSDYASTFSKQKSIYQDNIAGPDVQFVGFSVKNDANAYFQLATAVRDQVLSACQWVYDQWDGSTIPPEASHTTFVNNLTAALQAINVTATNVVSGIIIANVGYANIPEYIQWEFDYSGNTYTAKVWFTDPEFRVQYDEYEIAVINPLAENGDLDALGGSTAAVGLAISQITPAQILAKVQFEVGINPATAIVTHNVIWHDPSTPASTLTTTWTLVIWGQAGNNVDNIKEAIRNYITATAVTVTLAVWQEIYPDIYNETEFAYIPLWNYIASPETLLDYGIYSPTVRPNLMKNIALANAPSNYGDLVSMGSYLDLHMQLTATVYRSMSILSVSYPANPLTAQKFSQLFPDYMAVPTSSLDFARMVTATQDFATELVAMLEIARELLPGDPAPIGYSKVTRGGKLYVGKDIGGVLHLVLTKDSYTP